jgi:hypothetical protein
VQRQATAPPAAIQPTPPEREVERLTAEKLTKLEIDIKKGLLKWLEPLY